MTKYFKSLLIQVPIYQTICVGRWRVFWKITGETPVPLSPHERNLRRGVNGERISKRMLLGKWRMPAPCPSPWRAH